MRASTAKNPAPQSPPIAVQLGEREVFDLRPGKPGEALAFAARLLRFAAKILADESARQH
jgi:hypothetical protein